MQSKICPGWVLAATALLFFLGIHGEQPEVEETKYILFDINPGEGFNLRRDVSMRMLVMAKQINELNKGKFVLVLPPWGRLYHWQSRQLGQQTKIPWGEFFDVESINRFTPVIELEEFIAREGTMIDKILYLQRYAEGWENGKFTEKFDYRECVDKPRYNIYPGEEEKGYRGWFWAYDEMSSREFECLSIQGHTTTLKQHVAELGHKSLMIDRAETMMHARFGDLEYWSARRSMRFAKRLTAVADKFRAEYLDSNDKKDKTVKTIQWENFIDSRSSNKGGPYLCIHLRRKDFVYSRKDQIPGLRAAADQIQKKLKDHALSTVFISTDAPLEEYKELKSYLEPEGIKVTKFMPTDAELETYKDGGVAIIDQDICAHAKHFVGSRESTFSFRIQEEREIMGFQTKSTFDMLCPDGEFDCTKGSTWKIVWPDKPNPPKPEEAAPLPARTLPTATPVKINVTSAGKKVPTDYPPAPPAPIPAAPKPLPPAPPAPKATRAPEKPPKSQQTLEKESEKRTEEKESGKDGKTEL